MKTLIITILLFTSIPFCLANDFKEPVELQHRASDSVKIYPIGWSKDGNFAFIRFNTYSKEPVYYEFIIQSAVTDEILYSKSIYKGRRTSLQDVDDIRHIWNGYYDHFKNMLTQYGIQNQDKPSGGKSGAFSYKNRSYSINVSQTKVDVVHMESKVPPPPEVDRAAVVISSESLGKKRVYIYSRNEARQNREIPVVNTFCAGYIQSPLEDRIVIIYIKDHAERDKKSLQMIGAHLTTGFK